MPTKITTQLITSILVTLMLIFASFVLVVFALDRVLDTSIRQQDTMLCYSASTSGNVVWAKKCKCYYEGDDISCIYLKRPLADELH